MPAPRVLIVRAPGTNCDGETAYAFELAGGKAEIVHVNRLVEDPKLVGSAHILCIPGGFSYGDDIAAGKIMAERLHHHLADALAEFREAGKLILGICNGFQVLAKTGLLGEGFTLTWNDHGRYEDRWVNLAADSDRCVFLQGIDSLFLPIAHAEGKFAKADENVLDTLSVTGRLCLRYSLPAAVGERILSPASHLAQSPIAHPPSLLPFPHNPNGSQRNVAGVCDETGRVFGLMPHPERYIDPTHHPRWTRAESRDPGEGLSIFQNAVAFFD